jgi:two-component system, OmpR family, sensor histidine kinase QseC
MRSIRTFLIVVLIAAITLMTFLAALQGYRASVAKAEQLFDAQLMQKLRLIGRLVQTDGRYNADSPDAYRIDPEPFLHLTVFDQNYRPASAFQVWNALGELVVKSENAPGMPLTLFQAGFADVNFQGYRWRALTDFNADEQLWIMTAERYDVRYTLADSVILESLLPIIFALPLLALLIWLVVGLGMKPITDLAASIRQKEATDLTPIEMENVPVELVILAQSANELFRRLTAAFEQAKRFTADAAHELRNPIAALKIHAANLLAEMKEPSETALQLKTGIDRLSHLVEQLLTLNRIAPDHYLAQLSCLDLHEVAQKVIQGCFAELQRKQQSIELQGGPTEIYGDLFALEILLQNLLSNAIKYTPERGSILIRIGIENAQPVLRVIDTGPGIPIEERARVFERFYRVGGDRHASNAPGCGLGLSIVQQIAQLHGASIILEASEFGSGLAAVVRFPQTVRCINGRPQAQPGNHHREN